MCSIRKVQILSNPFLIFFISFLIVYFIFKITYIFLYIYFIFKKIIYIYIFFFILKKILFIYLLLLLIMAGHVTAHLLGCWHAGKIWGCVTILALSLDGVGISQYCPVHQLF